MKKQIAKSEDQTPAETENQMSDSDLAVLMATANDLLAGDFVGVPLKFNKGDWTRTAIENDQRIEVTIGDTETFIVDPLSFAESWVKWRAKKVAGKVGPGRRVDGFILPSRDELGDLNENDWEWRGDKRQDPWTVNEQITVKATGDGTLLTWVTSSWGGRKAIGHFLKAYAREAKRHPGEYPVALLTSRSEPHPEYGTVIKPILKIVSWQAFGDGAAPPGMPLRETQQVLTSSQPQPKLTAPTKTKSSLADDMGDSIPF
jgi:hypothetical protein